MILSQIAKILNAKFYGQDRTLPAVVTDTRHVCEGKLFVAIQGAQFDGHDFIESAIQQGATAILAQRAPSTALEQTVTWLEVHDTILALGRIAQLHRSQFTLPVVGITGSCGKTTVKGMLASICEQQGSTLATQGNFNNHIGLPLTLLQMNASHRYAVIEMGANGRGNIDYLCQIAQPNMSLITNVNVAHLQGFGSLDGVAQAKGEIYSALPDDGIAILNVDEHYCEYWQKLIADRKTLHFGLSQGAQITASSIQLETFSTSFILHVGDQKQNLTLQVPGLHMLMNALAACAAAHAMGISCENMVFGLQQYQGIKGRLNRHSGMNGATIIDDTYNANPGSMNAALDILSSFSGLRLFVMGDMGELGDNALEYHSLIGANAKQKGIEQLYAVGELSAKAVAAFGDGAKHFDSKQTLLEALKAQLSSDTTILIKGSRSARMEEICEALINRNEQ